ncbi:MAG: hypothetical protein IKC79_02865 [Clostridia bacterium]|nr:hypothetical protein [Clostridia bacterium]
MSIKPAKCPNCGAKIMVETNKDARMCPVCNEPFLTEEAITALKAQDMVEPDKYEPMVSMDTQSTNEQKVQKYSQLPKYLRDEYKKEFKDIYSVRRQKILWVMIVSGVLGIMLLLMALLTNNIAAWILMAICVIATGLMVYLYVFKYGNGASRAYLNWLAENKNVLIDR